MTLLERFAVLTWFVPVFIVLTTLAGLGWILFRKRRKHFY